MLTGRNDTIDYFLTVLDVELRNGVPQQQALWLAIESTIEACFSDSLEKGEIAREKKLLIDMTDEELREVCAEEQARLQGIANELKKREDKNGGCT